MKKAPPVKKRLKKSVKKESTDNLQYPDYQNLPLFDKVFLGTLLSDGQELNYNFIRPLNSMGYPLMPNNELLLNTISRFIQEGILIILNDTYNPLSLPLVGHNHYNIHSKKQRQNYPYLSYLLTCQFTLNCDSSEKTEVIQLLISHPEDIPYDENELLHLWRVLAAWECVEYLEHKVSELFDLSPVNKNELFNLMSLHLNELSQAEIFKTIETSVFNAFSYTNLIGISRDRGAENALNPYRLFANNAIEKEGWYKRAFKQRPRDAPMSLILKYYLKEFLNREDDGFDFVFGSEKLSKVK